MLLRLLVCVSYLQITTSSSWLKNTNVMAWQLNPQLYLLGASPKCTSSKARLSPLQNAMCANGGYQDHMSSVNVGLLIALNECRFQLHRNKWNCSDVQVESMLEGIKNIKGSKEDALMHALAAAGITHSIARGCRNGLISKCSCSEMERPKTLHRDWVWGGCGDNLNYGYEFAYVFIDLRERESNHPKGSNDLAMMLMNKHNNEAGRRIVEKGNTIACKCHGVSGSCTLKTCWQELVPFRKIGDKLKEHYDTAMQVAFNKAGTSLRSSANSRRAKRKASKEELIYLKALPDMCDSTRSSNISMTGRVCNATSTGEDNCSKMCCNQGYERRSKIVTKQCNCQFQWCCFVQCDECTERVDFDVCS